MTRLLTLHDLADTFDQITKTSSCVGADLDDPVPQGPSLAADLEEESGPALGADMHRKDLSA